MSFNTEKKDAQLSTDAQVAVDRSGVDTNQEHGLRTSVIVVLVKAIHIMVRASLHVGVLRCFFPGIEYCLVETDNDLRSLDSLYVEMYRFKEMERRKLRPSTPAP